MNDLSNCTASEPFALRVIGDDMAPEFVDGFDDIVGVISQRSGKRRSEHKRYDV